MHSTRTSYLGTIAALLVLSGCASLGPELSTESSSASSASDREDILKTMERDSQGG